MTSFIHNSITGSKKLILGSVLFYTVIVAFANLLVDLLYAMVDPRIRYT